MGKTSFTVWKEVEVEVEVETSDVKEMIQDVLDDMSFEEIFRMKTKESLEDFLIMEYHKGPFSNINLDRFIKMVKGE